jgi:DNA-binding LytR/AlgR family response regulator
MEENIIRPNLLGEILDNVPRLWPDKFLKVKRWNLVNPNHVTEIKRGETVDDWLVVLAGKTEVPATRNMLRRLRSDKKQKEWLLEKLSDDVDRKVFQ